MDFFAKHYEKLILAFCLILLLVGIAVVALSATKTNKELSDNYQAARKNVEGGSLVQTMDVSSYNLERYFNDPRKFCAVLGNSTEQTDKGSMIEANKMIMCENPDCKHMLLLKTDICPFCNTKEPELSKSTGKDEDTDGDGIPDIVEQKYDFLNYRNPNDALMDQDGDGFLNIEEIKAGADPDNAEEFPPLALLLRVDRIYKTELGIELVEIEKNRSDDVKKWEVVFKGFDPKRRKVVRMTVMVGETLLGKYKVTAAGFEGEGDMAAPYAVIVPEDVADEEYRLKVGEKTFNKRLSVSMIYYRTRSRNDVLRFKNRMRINRMQDSEFPLSKQKSSGDNYIEYYKIAGVDEAKKTCQVALLDAKGGKTVKTFDIPAFDEKSETDFIFEDRSRGDMLGEDMLEPGMEVPRPPRGGGRGPGMEAPRPPRGGGRGAAREGAPPRMQR